MLVARCWLVAWSFGLVCCVEEALSPPGPLHSLEETRRSSRGPVVVIYGAIGRHNFGDVLMGEVTAELLRAECGYPEHGLVFADVLGQDMRIFGGSDVLSVAELRWLNESVDVVTVGGQVLAVGFYGAVNMNLGGGAAEEHLRDWPAGTRAWWRDEWRAQLYEPLRNAVSIYLPDRSWFRWPGAMVASAVGGPAARSAHAIRGLDFASFRDDVLVESSVLAPDSVVLLRELFGDRLEALADASKLGSKRYVAVQFGPSLVEDPARARLLASQVAEIARAHRLDVVLFLAGMAREHGTLDSLGLVSGLIAEVDPRLTVQVFRELNVWAVSALISRAELVLSTSLHARIVAFAYARPRLALEASPKYARFVELWNRDLPAFALSNARPGSCALADLADNARRALAEPERFLDPEPARRAGARYLRTVFRPYAKLLTRDCLRPKDPRLATLDHVPSLEDASPQVISKKNVVKAATPAGYALGPVLSTNQNPDYKHPPRNGPLGTLDDLLRQGQTPCVLALYGGQTEIVFGMTKPQCLEAYGIDIAVSELQTATWAQTNEQTTFSSSRHLLP